MQILDIPASELHLNDVLDEGMEIWLIVRDEANRSITVRWGERSSLINPSPTMNFINYKPTDIVRVIRR